LRFFPFISAFKDSLALLKVAKSRFSRAGENLFTVVFYGPKTFCCNTAQFSETLRESACLGLGLKNRRRNITKTSAKTLS
jgi:hypothetical protein